MSGYAGSSQFIVAAIKGEADAVSTGDVTTEMRYIRAGELRPIVVFTLKPSVYLPDVPHLGGTPYEQMAHLTPFDRIVAAPPGVPDDVLKTIEKAFMGAVNDKDYLAWAKKANRPVSPQSAKDTTRVVKTLIELYSNYAEKVKK